MWKVKTNKGYYTVTFCPMCRKQRTFHTVGYNVFQCDVCKLKMYYDYKGDRLKL